MTDLGLPYSATNRPSAKDMWGWVARGEVGLAIGVVGIIVLLILPVPAFLLDLLLALSIMSAVLILMTSLMIKKPVEFTAFPTVLLVTTLFRLGLDIASTRLILGHGHEGAEGAGHIIQAFGQLMMQGNYVIGVIVFAILVLTTLVRSWILALDAGRGAVPLVSLFPLLIVVVLIVHSIAESRLLIEISFALLAIAAIRSADREPASDV